MDKRTLKEKMCKECQQLDWKIKGVGYYDLCDKCKKILRDLGG